MATRRWHHITADIVVIVILWRLLCGAGKCATILGRENARNNFCPKDSHGAPRGCYKTSQCWLNPIKFSTAWCKQGEGDSSQETTRRCPPGDLETVPRRRRRACWKPFSLLRIPGRRRGRDGGSSHFVQMKETTGGGLFVHGINNIFSKRIFSFFFSCCRNGRNIKIFRLLRKKKKFLTKVR